MRTLLCRPAYTLIVIGTLAAGIGTMTAVFSIFHALLLEAFPFRDPERLVRIFTVVGNSERGGSLPDVDDWRRRSKLLKDIGAQTVFDADIRANDGTAIPVRMAQLDPEALSAPGVTPMLGRLFLPEENAPGGDVNKAVISAGLWRSRFEASPSVVGSTLRTPQAVLTVVGVMPEGFGYPDRVDVWTPMETYYAASSAPKRRSTRFYAVVARLAPGATLAAAEQELNSICAQLEREHPNDNREVRARLKSLREVETGDLRPYLMLLLSASSLVVLICCANVSGMMLARAAAERHDLGVRLALGADHWQLLRPLLTEAAWIALLGGALGALLAALALQAIHLLIPPSLMPAWLSIRMHAPIFGFAFVMIAICALLCATVPVASLLREDLNAILRGGGRGISVGRAGMRKVLVVSEIALSLVLLTGAGLLMRTFLSLRNADTGFQSEGLWVARVSVFQPGSRTDRAALLSARHNRVLEEIRKLPGVVSAGATNGLPYAGVDQKAASVRGNSEIRVNGRDDLELRRMPMVANADVSAGYLETMGIRLVRGRLIDRADSTESALVVVVSQRAAETLWPGRDPIGQEVGVGAASADNPLCRVVGVVSGVRHEAGEPAGGIEFYYPYTQYPASSVYFVVRGAVTPAAIRSAILAGQRDAAILLIRPMEALMSETLWQRRLWGVLFAVFAALAVALAAVGLFGLMRYLVAGRVREFGVRLALGAKPSNVLAVVLFDAMKLALLGAVCGYAGSLVLAWIMRKLLAGVATFDAASFLIAGVVLAIASGAAAIAPAIRASATDPVVALRE
jgi:putative ABC transport system permease protein